jgi:nucleotide-binding universal stress UspA family protein
MTSLSTMLGHVKSRRSVGYLDRMPNETPILLRVHVVIATAGALSPSSVLPIIEPIVGSTGIVTVMSAIGVPRSFLEELATEEWRPFVNEDRPPETEAAVAKYVEERGRRLVNPLLSVLEAHGVSAQPVFVEDEDAARAIVETATQLEADLIALGSTRPIFDEDAWQSVSVKVMQQTKIPLLLIPSQGRTAENPISLLRSDSKQV